MTMALGLATTGRTAIEDPPLARFLFSDPLAAPLWLVLRVFLGYQWVTAGWHKVQDPAWMATGDGLKGFLTRAAALPAAPARAAITFDWYRSFLQALLDAQVSTGFAKVVAVGELLIGVALILAWKVAGYAGLDRSVRPALGTPRPAGPLARARRAPAGGATALGGAHAHVR
jgi:thiosulfate dehydrogenase [quinone] large subunit